MTRVVLCALGGILALSPAWAGEVVLVDPIVGTVTTLSSPPRGVADGAQNSSRDEARQRIEDVHDQGWPTQQGGVVIVQPDERVGTGTIRQSGDAGRQATRAAGKAAAYSDENTAPQLEAGGVIVVQDGQARVIPEGQRVDNQLKALSEMAKANARVKGRNPCGGSVIVGGVGEQGAATPDGSSLSRDVYVIDNCR